MTEPNRVGVFVCHCGTNIAATVDVEEVAEKAKDLPNVICSYTNLHACSIAGQEQIQKAIEEDELDSVVVAACSPQVHENTFRGTISESGLNPYMLEIANIREHVSWVHGKDQGTTDKALDLVKSATAKAAQLEPLEVRKVPVTQAALVIGGGVAGIQTALDLADAGQKVYLVEKQASIGGNMAKLNKVFPTLDCSACILTPKMNSVGQHPNIELFTLAEVEQVDGSLGNFKVTVRQRPRFITETVCTSCGHCMEKCPVNIESEFDHGLVERKAIYKPFDTAVPAAYVIDPDYCVRVNNEWIVGPGDDTDGVCRICEMHCDAEGGIDFDAQDDVFQLDVGTIVVATGYKEYEPLDELKFYGYKKHEDVITTMQMERLLAPNGPTEGELKRPSDGKVPQRVAIVSCVGSRDEQLGQTYCSRVCCMIMVKNSMIVKEHYPDAHVKHFYMDMRTFGKDFEEMWMRAQEMGISYVRGRVAEVDRNFDGSLSLLYEDTLIPALCKEDFDMVVLASALRPQDDAQELGQRLRVACGNQGFYIEAHPKLKPVDSKVDGIYLAGACQFPKDIPDSVAQGSAAAARAMIPLVKGEVEALAQIATVDLEDCSGCGICEAVCPFSAIQAQPYGDDQQRAHIDPAVCKGCGVCVSACPTAVIKIGSWEEDQILGQLDAILTETPKPVAV